MLLLVLQMFQNSIVKEQPFYTMKTSFSDFFFSCYIISIFKVSFLILHGISFSDSFVNTVLQYKATGKLCRTIFIPFV